MSVLFAFLLLIGSGLDFVGRGTLVLTAAVHPAKTCRYAGKARRFPVAITGIPSSVVWQLEILESEGRCVVERSPATVLVRQVATGTGRILLDMPSIGLFEIEPRDPKVRDLFRRLAGEAPAFGFAVEPQRVDILVGEHTVQVKVLDGAKP